MDDHDQQLLTAALDNDSRVVKFPAELEKQYILHHAETRLIISNSVLAIGMSAFLLFTILDYIVFPFYAAVTAWIIRALTAAIIVLLIISTRRLENKKTRYVIASASMIIVNAAVVGIDIIGVNSAGYDLPLGSLFVIIFSSTLIRFPFRISLYVVSCMVLTQFSGLLLFTRLGPHDIIRNFLFFSFIIIMLLFSTYGTDADSRRIFLLNIFRKKYERSGLNKADAAGYAASLDEYMLREKPYLDPDLRIDDVARALKIKRHHLTQIINERYNRNFFMYVNEFRIRDAKKLMSDKSNDESTILRIAYDTGFNSKATFNRLFKAITGVTPSKYRNKS